jgi:hypothetical protein
MKKIISILTIGMVAATHAAVVTYNFDTGLGDTTSGADLSAGTIAYAVGSNSDSGTLTIQDTAVQAWDNTRASGDYILNIGQRGIGNSGTNDANFDIGAAAQLSFTITPNTGEALSFVASSMTFDSFFYADDGATDKPFAEGYKVWADTGSGFVALAPLQVNNATYVASTGNALYATDELTLLGDAAPLSDGIVFSQHDAMSFDISSLGALASDQSVTFAITISGDRNNQRDFNTAVDNIVVDNIVSTGGTATPPVLSGPGLVSNGTEMSVSWAGESGVSYSLETNSVLTDSGSWGAYTSGIIGAGAEIMVTNTINENQLFYRVIAE